MSSRRSRTRVPMLLAVVTADKGGYSAVLMALGKLILYLLSLVVTDKKILPLSSFLRDLSKCQRPLGVKIYPGERETSSTALVLTCSKRVHLHTSITISLEAILPLGLTQRCYPPLPLAPPGKADFFQRSYGEKLNRCFLASARSLGSLGNMDPTLHLYFFICKAPAE